MLRTVFLLCLVLVPVGVGAEGNPPAATFDLLPAADEFPGWKPGERRTVLSAKGLYDYMDGGAEVYLDYGFQDLAVAEWTSPEGDPLKVEIYRMRYPKGACGMFTQDTWGEEVDLGQGARIQGGTLRFWKGEFFVRVFMWRGYKAYADLILEAGRSIARRIVSPGEVPALMSCLPAAGLEEGGIHFFQTPLTLGTFYYLSEGNPLGLSEGTDGAIGEYLLEDGSTVFLVVVCYPDSGSAGKALEGWRQEVGPRAEIGEEGEPPREVVVSEENGLWRKAVRSASCLVLALDCPSRDSCDGMVRAAAANLKALSGGTPGVGKPAGAESTR